MIKISIINDEISDDINEVVDFLKNHNLKYVEIRSFNKKNVGNINISELKKYANYFKKNNIKISCIASPLLKWNYLGGSVNNLADNHFFLKNENSYESIFKIADLFNTKYIRIFSFLKYQKFKISDIKSDIDKLILLAEKYNKILLIENEPVCNIDDINYLKKFIEFFKSNRIKILFDPGNLYKKGKSIDYDELLLIKDYIKYVHIKDYSFVSNDYSILGEGDINYKKFFSWIQREKIKGLFFSLETHIPLENRIYGSGKSVDYLKKIIISNRVKYGIVGCGRISKKHILAIRNSQDSELIGVFDIKTKKGKLVANSNDCENYSSLDKLISSSDVINVCTPHNTHAKIINTVLKKNKYCLCEKPGSINKFDIDLVKSNKNYKNKLFIVFQNRYNKPIIELKKIINSNTLGKPIYIFGSVRWFRPKNYYLKSWQGNKDKEGGILFNQGVHIIDIIISLLKSYKAIKIFSAVKEKIYHKIINTEDLFIAQFKLDKTFVNLEITVSSLPNDLNSSLFIIFENGRAVINGKSLETSLDVDIINTPPVRFSVPPNSDIYGSAHKELIKNLTKYIKTGNKDKNLVDFDQACDRIKLINNLYKSIK